MHLYHYMYIVDLSTSTLYIYRILLSSTRALLVVAYSTYYRSVVPVGCIILPPTKYCPVAARARAWAVEVEVEVICI